MPVAHGECLRDGDVGSGGVKTVIGKGGGGVFVQRITFNFISLGKGEGNQ